MKYYSKFLCKFRRHAGQISLAIDKILNARFEIMNKIFQDPEVPDNIKKLKERAYGGNYHWAAVESFGIGQRNEGVKYLLKAYETWPEYKERCPLFSVVTPSKNSELFLEDCIKSVLSQDYTFVEHIIQDSASTDDTLKILRKYDNQTDWKSEADEGESEGLDKALKRANGEIIVILNSDDLLLKSSCSLIRYFFRRYPDVAVIYGNQFNVSSTGQIKSVSIGPSPYDFGKVFCSESVIPAQAAFIKRHFFEESGLYADRTLKICPDYEIWIRLGLRYKMKYINYFLARYRQHADSFGRNVENIKEMAEAKIKVIDRALLNNSGNSGITGLKHRAYGGVYFWAGICTLGLGEYKTSLSYFRKSKSFYPLGNKVFTVVLRKLKKQLAAFLHITFIVVVKSTLKYRSQFGLTKENLEYLSKFLLS